MPLLNPNNYKILKYISYDSNGHLNELVPLDWPIVLYNPELANKKFLALKNLDGSIIYQENDGGTLYEHDDDFSLGEEESDEDESGEMNPPQNPDLDDDFSLGEEESDEDESGEMNPPQNPDLDDDFSLGEEESDEDESDEEQQASPPMPVVPFSHSNNGLFNHSHALHAHRRSVVRNLLDDLNFKP